MKRTTYLIGIAFLISMISVLGFARDAKALIHNDYSEVISDPHHHAKAIVWGSWTLLGKPYYAVHHEGWSYNCAAGTGECIGWNKQGQTLYDVYRTCNFTYDPAYYNVVQCAKTVVVAGGETAEACIGPPGST